MLDRLVEGLWQAKQEYGTGSGVRRPGLHKLAITLDYGESFFNYPKAVQRMLTGSLANVHGFGEVVITGAIDHERAQHFLEQLPYDPDPDLFLTVLKEYSIAAQKAYNTGFYRRAIQHWRSVVSYVELVKRIANFFGVEADSPLPDILRGLDPKINKICSHMAGASLCRGDPQTVLGLVSENEGNRDGNEPIAIDLTQLAKAFAKFMMSGCESAARNFSRAVEAVSQTVDDIAASLEFLLDHYDDNVFAHPMRKELFLRLQDLGLNLHPVVMEISKTSV